KPKTMKPLSRTTWLLIVILSLLWVFAVYASFYLVQKPAKLANALALVDVVLNLATASFIVLLGMALGRWLFERCGFAPASLAEELVMAAGLGLGLLSLVSLALGLVGLFQAWLFYLLSAGLALLLYPQWRQILILGGRAWEELKSIPRPLASYLALTGLMSLFLALAPPISWDALFYHLTGPKLYIQAQRITPDFRAPHFHFPSLMETLFAYAMLLKGDVAAKLIHFAYGPLTLASLYLFARRYLAPSTAWLTVAIAASMPMLALLSSWAYNDVALAFYTFAAFYALINWRHSGKRGWLILSGSLAGLVMSIKYTGFVTPLALLTLLLWWAWSRQREASTTGGGGGNLQAMAPAFIFSLVVGLFASSWYLKNLAFTGNPVYPFLFSGVAWDTFRATWYQRAGTGLGLNLIDLATLPWVATLGYRDANFYDGRTGPILLALLPLILLGRIFPRLLDLREGRRERQAVNYLLFFVGLQYTFWTLGVVYSASLWQSRLLLPTLILLSPVAAHTLNGLERIARPQFSLKRFLLLVIAMALVLNLVSQGLDFLTLNPLPYLTGLESKDGYLTRVLGDHYRAMSYINDSLPTSARLLFLWEPRSYYSQRATWPDAILDNFAHLLHLEGSVEGVVAHLRREGITHVLIYQWGVLFTLENLSDLVGADEARALEEFERRYLTPIYRDDNGKYVLYRFEAP
ncbi:MAG: ArnT family glycosyltransferase, partial [Anaerolineae bacterium]